VATSLTRTLRLACVATAGLLVAANPTPGRATAVNGLIAVESDALATPQIWLMRPDGSHARWFTDGAAPAWSSDGTKLVYLTPDRSRIAITELDGTRDMLAITNAPAGISSPALSPNGATVAFAGVDGLYLVGTDGGTATRLATAYEPGPAWSPDGAWIAFVDHDSAVALVRPDGSGFHELPRTHTNIGSRVTWAPDGTEITYGDATGGLSSIRLDGSPPTQLIPNLGDNTLSDPAWSPDGTRIAFFDNADICLANRDGTDISRLTYTPITNTPYTHGVTTHPAWQPLPTGSGLTGSPPAGPRGTWNHNHSWYPACGLPWQGLTVTVTGPLNVAANNQASLKLTVTNHSDTPLGTSGLVGVGAQLHGGIILGVRTSQGQCDAPRDSRHFTCDLGALWPHQKAHLKLQLRAGRPGELVLTCYLPRPASGATETAQPDCIRRIKIGRHHR
jgi:Tol biopolymer transport system component